ncbi:MAG: TonB family protein [Mucilaginibacter sp.]
MTWWHYLLLVNIYLLLFYGFYFLLLRKETFFQLNRIYLILASILSFFIPMIQSNWVRNLFITKEVQLTIYSSPLVIYRFKPIIQNTQVTFGDILAALYLLGMLFLTGRFVWQMVILRKIINQPPQTPFSFFKKVRLNAEHQDNDIIAAHEHVHARQWHSADVLLMEAVMIVNWFNPIVYLYRFTIKHIHEYIADRQAVKFGTNKSDYALLLVSQTFNAPAHKLVNPFFNHSLLKQRILMLQKNHSKRAALIKYGLSAPLFMLMLVLSSATVYNSKTVGFVNRKVEQVLETPASVPSAVPDSSTMVMDVSPKPNDQPDNTAKRTSIPDVITASAGKATTKEIAGPEPATPEKKDIDDNEKSPVFIAVEKVPQFPGGIDAFYHYLAKNIRYPAAMRDAGVQGKVIVTFVVERDGSLTDVRVTRGVAADIDMEALRVIQESPKWTPGIQNGRAVRVAYSVPIAFNLVDNDYSSSAAPAKQNVKVPAVRVNTVSIKPDTIARIAPQSLKESSAGAQVKPNSKEAENPNKGNHGTIDKLGVLLDKEASNGAGVKASGGAVLHRTASPSLGRYYTY